MRLLTFQKITVSIIIALVIGLSFAASAHGTEVPCGDSIKRLENSIKTIRDSINTSKSKTTPTITSIIVYPERSMERTVASYGDRIEVRLQNFDTLITHKCDNDSLVLYLDNYRLSATKGLMTKDGSISFIIDPTLDKEPADDNFWTCEYKTALHNGGLVSPSVKIGTSDGKVITAEFNRGSSKESFQIRIYGLWTRRIIWVIFVIFSILLCIYSSSTDILRENCECTCVSGKKKKPFSLSRTQMAFWTVIVAFAFSYIYIMTGEMPDITNGTLVLLGISSTTTLTGYVVDNNSPLNAPNVPALQCCSKGFLNDILSDAGIFGIHRLQNIVFTIILGAIYLTEAVKSLYLTEFNANLLILMGISSGTYIGVKYFANQALAHNIAAPQPPPPHANPVMPPPPDAPEKPKDI